MKRVPPKRSVPVPIPFPCSDLESTGNPIHKKPRTSRCPTVVYFKNPIRPKPVVDQYEPYRNPGSIVMDQITSAFSASGEVKAEAHSPTSAGDVSESEDQAARFTSRRKIEIQHLIDLHQCRIEPFLKDQGMNQIVKDDEILAYQCGMCLALFSPITKSHIRKHIRKCRCKAKNQFPYTFTEAEKKQMNLHLAELSAVDGFPISITETEAFKQFVNYIGNLFFIVGRGSTNLSIPPDFLPPSNEFKDSLSNEVNGLVTKFQAFLKRKSDLHYTIVLDSSSLRYNSLGISIQFLYEWELKTVLLGVYEHAEVTSDNVKDTVSRIKTKFGLNFENQFIVVDGGSAIDGAFDPSEYTVNACQSLNTVVKRTTNPHKESKRNGVEVDIDEDTLAQVTIVQERINDLKMVLTPEALSRLGKTDINEGLRWMSKYNLIQAWFNLTDDDMNKLFEYYGDDEEKATIVQNLTQSQNELESCVIVMSPFYYKMKLLDDKIAPTINHVLIAYYELEDQLKNFVKSDKPLLKALSTSALKILQLKISTFTHPIHYAACTLDIFQRGKIFQLRGTAEVQKARAETEALLIKYVKQNTVTSVPVSSPPNPGMNSYLMDPNDMQEYNNHEIIDAAKVELSKYYRYLPSPADIQSQNVLNFWKAKEYSFPNLTKFANYIFSIPANSNSIEKIAPELLSRGESVDASTISDFLLYKSIKKFFVVS